MSNASVVSLVSQRPIYDRMGPLMTARFGEVRWTTGRNSTKLVCTRS